MDPILLKVTATKAEVNLDALVNRISSGKAILFTGAGFSYGAETVNRGEPLGAVDLSKLLSRKAGIEENNQLGFTSDYFLSKFKPDDLIELLKQNYDLLSASNSQIEICKLNWRRFYTTNYDNAIELAAKNSGKTVEAIDLSNSTKEFYRRKNLCIHLNGSIQSVTSESLNNTFKLSNSSYVSPDSFVNSDWNFYFRRDLDRASAIVFVGYSLYDIDVQRILKEDESLKEKTYFITQEKPDLQLEFTLSKYGHVLKIGTDGFADLISKIEFTDDLADYQLQSLAQYSLSDEEINVRDNDVERMLMYGDVSDSIISNYVLSDQKLPMLVIRNELSQISEFIKNRKNVIVYSGLGNGKTILLEELKCLLSANGTSVYILDDEDGDYISDIDFLEARNQHAVLVLDDYESSLDLIEHVSRSGFHNITLIGAARTADHEYYRDSLSEMEFDYHEINIDTLVDSELEDFVAVIDNLGGLWPENAGTFPKQQINYLKKDHDAQISSTLVSLLNSPNIKSKIESVVKSLTSKEDYKSTILAICLCRILSIDANRSNISELSGNDSIYSPDLSQNQNFKNLFRMVDGTVVSGSSLFCIHIVKEYYSASYITQQLLSIAEKLSKLDSKDFVQGKIFKSMLKFSFIERILPATAKVSNLKNYYEALKVAITWLRSDPHFWLQYAMSHMGMGSSNYSKAQTLLDQAYSLARSKDAYRTSSIDTQQARLWLLKCDQISDGNIVFDNFMRANSLLGHLKTDVYKLRQIARYKDFYKNNFMKLSKSNKSKFLELCREMCLSLDVGDDGRGLSLSQLHRTQSILRSIEDTEAA